MDIKQYKGAVEALLFASGEPVSAEKLAESLEIETSLVEKLLHNIQDDYAEQDKGLSLLRLEDKYQLTTKPQFAPYIKQLLNTRRNVPLSSAALEVLAIIAYNQPVSRSFVEQVRGVDSSSVIQTLIAKDLVEEFGRLDLPGRPISYQTTSTFLRTFGLSSLQELPPLHNAGEESALEGGLLQEQEESIKQEAE